MSQAEPPESDVQSAPQVQVQIPEPCLSPIHLKLLVRVLRENLQRYESQFGEVPVTSEMLEQHQAPAHHIGFQAEADKPK